MSVVHLSTSVSETEILMPEASSGSPSPLSSRYTASTTGPMSSLDCIPCA